MGKKHSSSEDEMAYNESAHAKSKISTSVCEKMSNSTEDAKGALSSKKQNPN